MQIPNAKGNYENCVSSSVFLFFFDKNKQENVTNEIEIEIEIDKKATHPLFYTIWFSLLSTTATSG